MAVADISVPAGDSQVRGVSKAQVPHRSGNRPSVGRMGRRNRYGSGVAQSTSTPEPNASTSARTSSSPAPVGTATAGPVNKPTQGQFGPQPPHRRSPGAGSTCTYSPTNDRRVPSPPLAGGQGGDNLRLTLDAGLEVPPHKCIHANSATSPISNHH
ncbi:hypothetical protein BIW11_13797 [Tropilaelaps mercedesae]|uniref:Uncharacterized protein n=1 Tax=Tropilaelaps mercedesae TaxID=418985 RepID=A0A1V9X115_9ACAR|nr:hypothetical protein BIW11_13797 [Tropilaelaps mercedesae]